MAELNASRNGSSGVKDEDEWERLMEEFISKLEFAVPITIRIISAIEIVIMILTLFALCVLIKSHRSPPVFVIHLILSDLIQIICKLMMTIKCLDKLLLDVEMAYLYSLIAGVYFMACVAFERYLLVSHPIWYRSHHSVKVCCVISVIIWFVPLMFADVHYRLFSDLSRSIACLIPYPIIILCFIGTCRGLSRAISLTSLKRKQILGSLFLVLLTYTFLILPHIIMRVIADVLEVPNSVFHTCFVFSYYLLYLNPLADCVLYMFLRPDVGRFMKSVHCCCRTDTHQNSTHSRDEHSRDRSVAFACCVSVQKPASHSQTACSSV